jgi:hypothetical protein
MEEKDDKIVLNDEGKKAKWQIIVPIIVALIVVAVFIYLDYTRNTEQTEPNNENPTELYKPEPVARSKNPRRSEELSSMLVGCAGPPHIKPETLEAPDNEWIIKKDGIITVSLGKYRITAPVDLVFDIPKLWLYFFSDTLSDREDALYGLESSYTSKIVLIVNDFERKLNLGGDKYMFIELDDYPLGDLYPYDKETTLDFEFIIELECKNLENGACLGNNGEALDYINNADIRSQIRIFAFGCQEFSNDMVIDSVLLYN